MQSKGKLVKKNNKLSLKEFVWFGFNFVFGGTLSPAFASFANVQNDGSKGLGLWTLLTWFVVGIFAFICAKSFAKMSRYHDSSQNGASYVYTRSTFGKLTGLFVGFLQYCYLPFSLSYQIMAAIRGNFTTPFIKNNSPIYQNWGSFTDLYMDLIAIALFIGCSIIINFGMKWFKRVSHVTTFTKWIVLVLIIIGSLWIISSKDSSTNNLNGTNALDYWANHSTFNFDLFIKNFNACFFSFVGFELIITAGKNIENPNKNISKGLVFIMVFSSICYVSLCFLFMCVSQRISENYNIDFWSDTNVSGKTILPHPVIIMGLVFVVTSMLASRVYVLMHKSLYGGTSLQPLAVEGFFPDKFAKLNKSGLPISASRLNLIIVGSVSIIWLLIPDIIKGSLIFANKFNQDEVFFNMGAFSSFASLIAIVIYIVVLLATIKLMITHKIGVRDKRWMDYSELAIYCLSLLVLCLVVVYHYYNLINLVIVNHSSDQSSIKAITSLSIEFFSSVLIVLFFFTWYKVYYTRKIKTRTISKQKILDAPFKILNQKQINNLES